ncbi:MAG: complex I subunit 1 family protein [Bacteriovoracia bacterium]
MNALPELRQTLGMFAGLPDILFLFCFFLAVVALLLVPMAYLDVYVRRKFFADLQARVGPAEAGPRGYFQPLADFFKLIQKSPAHKPRRAELFWLGTLLCVALASVLTIPLSSRFNLFDTDMSAFVPLIFGIILSFFFLFYGFYRRDAQGWVGMIRNTAQALSGGFVVMVSILCVGLAVGGYRWQAILEHQGFWPGSWLVFQQPWPLFTIVFLAYYLGGLVVFSVSPFDAGFSRADLQGGFFQGVAGPSLSITRLLRFYGGFFWALATTVTFLGGWKLPGWAVSLTGEGLLLQVVQLVNLVMKVFLLMFATHWVVGSLPKPRSDQTTEFCWRILGPCALGALLIECLWLGGRSLF